MLVVFPGAKSSGLGPWGFDFQLNGHGPRRARRRQRRDGEFTLLQENVLDRRR